MNINRVRKPVHYSKPNMNNMRGKRGRQILEEIRNSPRVSMDKLENEVDNYVREIARIRQTKN